MRIGIDVTGLYITRAGIYYYTVNLLKHLLALDREHEFVLLDYAPVRGDRTLRFDLHALESDRSRWVEIKGPSQRHFIDWKPLDFFGGRFAAQCVDRILDRPWKWLIAAATQRRLKDVLEDLDVLHVSDVNRFAPGQNGLVSTVHDLSPMLFPEFHTQRNAVRFKNQMYYLQEHANAIIAVSEHTKHDLINVLEVSDERIHVVHNAADPRFRPIHDSNKIKLIAHKYGIPETGYILHVGTLEPRKNLARLIEAYAALLDHLGERAPLLVLVGGKGWFYEEVFQRVAQLRLESRVVFTDFVPDEDLPFLFNGALVFVYPSLYEGFGIPVLEAMACGVPVITSNVSALPEVTGDAGILVDPTDTGALTTAMATLLEDAEQRAALREAGLVQATSFSWERAARETLTVYESIAQ